MAPPTDVRRTSLAKIASPGSCRDGGVLAQHERGARHGLDVSGRNRLLRGHRGDRREDEREDAAEPVETAHRILPALANWDAG